MGGSSKQTVGFKYFAGMQVALGNCIEQILNINPDKRGWLFTSIAEMNQLKSGDTSMSVNKPDLFGGDKQEGGWVGTIDIHTGRESGLRQNEYLSTQDSELVSSFPNLSHLVFRGNTLDKGFQLVSMSGMLKEVLYWPKRTKIKSDGTEQWYKTRTSDDVIVCEIGTIVDDIKANEKLNSPSYTKKGWNYVNGSFDSFHSHGPSETDANIDTGFYAGTEYYLGSSANFTAKTDIEINFHESGIIRVDIFLSACAQNIEVNDDLSGLDILASYDVHIEDDFENLNGMVVSKRLSYIVNTNLGSSLKLSLISSGPVSLKTWSNYVCSIANYQARRITYKEFIAITDSAFDINPIHKIREIITDDTALNKPESMINDINFKAAADRIWDEALGISWAITEKSCKDAIDELLYHIEAGIRLNRQTGQYEIILFRDDLLDLDNAKLFDASNIKSFNIEIANVDDVINSVNVNYYDRENIKDSSFSLDEIGSVMTSELNAQTLDFPYFMNRRNAEKVGNWKLKQLSTPTRKGTFTTGKYEARKINKYDVVKLTWSNQNMFEVPVRIMKIGLGDGRDNTVTLDWVEVIPYSSTAFPTINVDPPTSIVLPPQANQSIVFEMPYFEAVQRFGQTQVDAELANNPDLGYLVVATKKPQNNSINALLYTDSGTGYQQASIVDYCPTCYLDQPISFLTTSFAVKGIVEISEASIGTLVLCDQELMVYQGYNPTTKILTVKRGALDTHPKPHLEDAVFYFYDAFNAYDSEQYVLSELIKAKVLTTTPSGIQDLASAPELPLEINARPIRPYPPVNIKINNTYFIENLVISNDVVVIWVDRNRIQQTGGSILGWTDGGVTKETGVTYSIELSSEGTVLHSASGIAANTYTINHSVLIPNKVHKLRLWSIRDGYDCYQVFEHSFFGEAVSLTLSATVSKDKVVGSTLPAASVTAVVDESLGANMRWDGTSIKGKAVAGSTITIEVQE